MRLIVPIMLATTLAVALSAGCSSEKEVPSQSPMADSPISWQTWSQKAFAQAKESDKLVFLYLEPFWCEPCVKMKENTFTDPRIVKLLSENFVNIYVNSERDPGLYERYQLGTYPSCVVLTSSAGMIGGSNALPPDSLDVLLNRILEFKKTRPEVLEQQASRLEQQYREGIDKIIPGNPSEEIVNNTERAVLSLYDSLYYGFGDQPKYPIPEALRFMMAAVSPSGLVFESQLKGTLDAQLALYDTVWGGFGRSARTADWLDVNHEKLLDLNSDMATLYLDACQIMADSGYCEVAEGALDYIWNFLRPPKGWAFYNSQRGILPADDADEALNPTSYFALSGEDRLAAGMPAIDSTAYAGTTAKAVSAFLRVGRALGRTDWEDYALLTLDSLLANSVAKSGAVRHQLIPSGGERGGLLPDQIAAASAFIDAYETTAEARYLTIAEMIAGFIVNSLEDAKLGGFAFETPMRDAVGREKIQIKPYILNSEAVWLFTRLYYLTANSTYQRPAETALRFVVARPVNKQDIRLPFLASAYMRLSRFPTLIVMIGEKNEPYHGLLEELWKSYYPREVIVHLGAADKQKTHGQLTFPTTVRPLMYACGYDTLSTAIFEPQQVHREISRFLRLYQTTQKK